MQKAHWNLKNARAARDVVADKLETARAVVAAASEALALVEARQEKVRLWVDNADSEYAVAFKAVGLARGITDPLKDGRRARGSSEGSGATPLIPKEVRKRNLSEEKEEDEGDLTDIGGDAEMPPPTPAEQSAGAPGPPLVFGPKANVETSASKKVRPECPATKKMEVDAEAEGAAAVAAGVTEEDL